MAVKKQKKEFATSMVTGSYTRNIKPKPRKKLIKENLQWRLAFAVAIFFAALIFASHQNLKDSYENRVNYLLNQNNYYESENYRLKINNSLLNAKLENMYFLFDKGILKQSEFNFTDDDKIDIWALDIYKYQVEVGNYKHIDRRILIK